MSFHFEIISIVSTNTSQLPKPLTLKKPCHFVFPDKYQANIYPYLLEYVRTYGGTLHAWERGNEIDLQENIEQMQMGDINFDDDEWGIISYECKDFIRRCLMANVAGRLNIEGVLTHPWLCGQSVYVNPYFTDLLKELNDITKVEVITPKKITIDRN